MLENNILIGKLKPGGYLKTEFGDVLLSTISMQTAQSPESNTLKIAEDSIGRTALLRGVLSGDVLYSAELIEVLSPISATLFETLLDKGVVSLEEFENELSKLDDKKSGLSKKKKLCALVIGHKKNSPGAKNKNSNLMEFDFNEALALSIEKKVKNVEIQRVYRRTYNQLPDDINALKPDFIVSLHCNAYDAKASGTEVLYYHKSKKSKKIAKLLQKRLVNNLKLADRGVKPKSSEDRGGYLLRYTNAPCIISEPFFIDNDDDLAKAKKKIKGLTSAYAKAINDIAGVV